MKIKAKEIIGQFLNSADQSSQEFLRLYNMLVWGLKTEFNLDITGTFKTVVLDVSANKTVALPCDYIQYSKIGVLNSRGEVVTFKRNEQLTTLNTHNVDSRTSGAPVINNLINGVGEGYPINFLYYNNYFFNGAMRQLFGANSGTPIRGEYKVDDGQRLIFLSQEMHNKEIVLEYLSDGFDDGCCDYSIDVRAGACMIAYLRWQNAIDQVKKYSQGQVREYKTEYYRNKRITKMRTNPFILNEVQHSFRVNNKLAPKA